MASRLQVSGRSEAVAEKEARVAGNTASQERCSGSLLTNQG